MPFDRHKCARDGRRGFRTDWPLDEFHAVFDQEIEGRDLLVGEHAHQIAVAVAAHACVEAHPVLEHLVGCILDVEFLLQGVAAAEMHAPAREHAAAADVDVLVDNYDGGAEIARRDGGGEAGDASADDHHIRRKVPPDRCALRPGILCGHRRQGGGADAGCAFRQERSPAHRFRHAMTGIAITRILAHFLVPPAGWFPLRTILTL